MTPYEKRELEASKELADILSDLTKHGYKCYLCDGKSYGYIITPSDNVMHIYNAYFGGWKLTLEYIPSRGNGSGCSTMEDLAGAGTVDFEFMKQIEASCYAFACKLRAELYKSSEQWFKKYWKSENLVLVA